MLNSAEDYRHFLSQCYKMASMEYPQRTLPGKTVVMGRRWFLAVILAPFLALQSISLAYYIREQRLLTAYVDSVASPSLPPSEQVKAIVLSLRNKNGEA